MALTWLLLFDLDRQKFFRHMLSDWTWALVKRMDHSASDTDVLEAVLLKKRFARLGDVEAIVNDLRLMAEARGGEAGSKR